MKAAVPFTKNRYQQIFNLIMLTGILFLFINIFYLKNDRLAYVDSTKILAEFKGSEKAKKAFESKATIWQNNIDTLTAGIQNSIKKYEQELATLSVREQNLTKQMIANQQKQLADYQRGIQQNAQEENSKLTQTVVAQVNSFLLNYGKAHSYKLILIANQSGTIAYAQDGLDITQEVIKQLNEEYLKGK
ncbi:OmpH family outer membrane protein [Pedobacter sp. MC2016-14]|uniref:OmpH family outer membrane protein n=1 Tax=Pedobacter sp. MC2016-14 TaxID=2897327 RepID=UPI001E4423FF|nr:OmpH family outer membrane protein [Pedobacter sp. MC2016-14]MCD0487342.1 OmpH family outer membrane protein [Pedobacter sp. MC2016-14]